MPIPAGQLVKNQFPISVLPTTSLVAAIELMIKHEFSQLPVVDEHNKPLGILTGNSITSALLLFVDSTVKDLEVKDAIIKLNNPPRSDNDILDITDDILRTSATLLTKEDGTLSSILTSYDTTQYFRTRAEDISLLEDIETTLKGHLKDANRGDALKEVINKVSNPAVKNRKRNEEALKAFAKKINWDDKDGDIKLIVDSHFPDSQSNKTFDDLTLEELIQAAENTPKLLATLFNNNLKKQKAWAKMMRNISLIRNNIFHFRGEPSELERQSLRFCAAWYRLHQPSQEEIEVVKEGDSTKVLNTEVNDSNEQNSSTSRKPLSAAKASELVTRILGESRNLSLKIRKPQKFEESIEEKYKPLVDFLKNQLVDSDANFLTTIDAIEKLIQQPLPKAAYEHPSWWTEYSTHTRQWLLSGWSVGAINLNSKRVEFYRWSYFIDIKDANALNYWSEKLGLEQEELLRLINLIGPLSTVIEDHIQHNKRK